MATAGIVDIAALSRDELEAELATLASHLYAGTCRRLEVTRVASGEKEEGLLELACVMTARTWRGRCGPPGA